MAWLDNSRIVAIFAVILLHSATLVVLQSPIGTESWWFGNLYDSLSRWCVPVFVMISGALLLDPGKKESLQTFYLKRLSRILIPILFWSVFFLLWNALKAVMKGESIELADIAKGILTGKPHYHMWFLYMIVFLYLFTPFFRAVVAYSSRLELLVLIVFLFVISAANTLAEKLFGPTESKLFFNWFLIYIPYYFLGYFISTSVSRFAQPRLWGGFLAFGVLTALGCYIVAVNRGLDAGLYFYRYLSITVIPMSVFIFYLLKLWINPIGNERITKKLSSLILGVYLVHPVFLELILYAGYGPLSFSPLISIPVTSVVVFCLSLGVAWAINTMPYVKRII